MNLNWIGIWKAYSVNRANGTTELQDYICFTCPTQNLDENDDLFTSVVTGRHMMVITARKGDSHFNELPKYIESQVNMQLQFFTSSSNFMGVIYTKD